MNILIACDSFKDSLKSIEVGETLKSVLDLNHHVELIPISDGGEGALDCILSIDNYQKKYLETLDPLGRKIKANYAIDYTSNRAFVEMAQSSGLELLSFDERDSKKTSTYGLGLLIKKIATTGIKDFTISIGGSATVDGGAGMLSALGVDFGIENTLEISNSDLINIKEIKLGPEFVKDLRFTVLADVDNCLLGKNGCVYTYAIQKGAREKDLGSMENAMENFAQKCKIFSGVDYSNISGSGAAGGVGFALMNFFETNIISGTDYFLDALKLRDKIEKSDLVISGEGSIDQQTMNSKLIYGISKQCKDLNKALFLVGGVIENRIKNSDLATRYFELLEYASDKEDSIKNSRKYLRVVANKMLELL